MKRRVTALFMVVCMTVSLAFAGQVTAAAEEIQTAAEETQQEISFTEEYPSLGNPLTVNVTGMTGTLSYTWTVDNVVKGAESSYIPTKDDLEKFIQVTVRDASGQSLSKQVFFSKLPVIYINTEGGAAITSKEIYTNADLIIQGNAEYNSKTTTLYNGATEIRGRGNTTWDLPKKPYKLKLDKKTDLFGFGKNKHWVLLANYYDTTYMRNKLSYDLSGGLGVPYMQSVLTDVVMNGRYVGNYQFCEQIKVSGDRVDILNWEDEGEAAADAVAEAYDLGKDDKKTLEAQMAEDFSWLKTKSVTLNGKAYALPDSYKVPDIDGGYLLEMDENYDEVSKFKTSKNQPIMFKEPEFAYTSDEMMSYVSAYIQAFEDAVNSEDYKVQYSGAKKSYTELFDMDSLVDNWLVQEIFFNEDFMKKSTYMYQKHDELFKMGPIWDMDWSSGAWQSGASRYDQWQTLYFSASAQNAQWYKKIVKDPYFLREVQSRYWEVRDTYIQEMFDSIDVISAQIKESAEASLAAWGQGGSYSQIVAEFKNWMKNRLAWMDSKMASYATFEREFTSGGTALNMSVTLADGTPLAADTKSRSESAYDAMASTGAGLKVQLDGLTNVTRVEIRVNGETLGDASLADNRAQYTIEGLAEDSVIQAFAYRSNGALAGTADFAVKADSGAEPVLESVIFRRTPTKTEYILGEEFELDGISVWGKYSDGILRSIPVESLKVEGYIPTQAGTQTVTISYGGESVEFTVNVVVQEYQEINHELLMENARANSWQDPVQNADGPASYAFNGDSSNWWHSRYQNDPDTEHGEVADGNVSETNPIWIETGFDAVKEVYGISYQGRTDQVRNLVGEYELQTACLETPTDTPEDSDYVTVKSGTLALTTEEQKIVLDVPVTATHIRLVAKSVLNENGTSRHVAASGIKVYELTESSTLQAVTGIKVNAPSNLQYFQGQQIKRTDLTVTASYTRGVPDKDVTALVEFVGYNPQTIGKQTVTVRYGGRIGSFAVTVVEAPEPDESASVKITTEYPVLGEPLEAEVTGFSDEAVYNWEVNGVVKGTGKTYTPEEKDLENFIRLTVREANGSFLSTQIFFSKLPVLYIDTENRAEITSKDNYVNAQFVMQGNAQYNQKTTTLYNGETQIRGRGNTTWGLPKKPYKLKLDKKTDIFGFGKSKHWVLLANYYDTTYMRNKLSYDLSGALGIPYMQSVLTDVVLNGQYVGNYQFCEQIKISDKRVDILNWEDEAEDVAALIAEENNLSADELDKLESGMAEDYTWVTAGKVTLDGKDYTLPDSYESPGIDGGYLLEMDENFDERAKFNTNAEQPIMFKEPEFADTNNEMMSYVRTYIQAFEDAVNAPDFKAVYEGEEKHYSELFDMDSLVDNWLVQEIFFNEDFMKKSTYMYKAHGELFKMGPIWDMDWSSGAAQSTAQAYDQWQTLYFSLNAQQNQWYKKLVQDPYFLRKVYDRYKEIRETHIQDMLNSIDTISSEIKESAEASLSVWQQWGSYDQIVSEFRQWMNNRIAWMDTKFASYDIFEAEFIKEDTEFDMKVAYADGTELEKSDSGDVVAEEGKTLKVALSDLKDVSKIEVLVNGKSLGTAEVKDGSVEYEIAGLAEDSVLQIYAYNAAGLLVGSSSLSVKVEKVSSLVSIEITKKPAKIQYLLNETLDMTGLEVTAVYSDESKVVLDNESLDIQSDFDGTKPGQYTVTVSYEGLQAKFTVTVIEKEISLEGIRLNLDQAELLLGRTLGLTVLYIPEDTTIIRDVTWTSSDEEKAIVDEDGNVKALWPGEVTITASVGGASAQCRLTITGIEKVYNDVFTDSWYYDAGNWAYINGIMTGLNATTFGADNNLVRAQFAVILYRIAGSPEIDETLSSFPDVEADPNNSWYKKAVLWASENQIITGYTDSGLFGTNDNITREQMATILYRYLTAQGIQIENTDVNMAGFPDAGQIQSFAKEAMNWAVAAELIKGDGGLLKPQGNANRAEAATIIRRFSGTYPELGIESPK